MKTGIHGITDLTVHYTAGEAVKINMELIAYPGYDPHHLLEEKWEDLFPGKVVVPCEHCGQFGARKTACVHCGAAIG